jgi:peptide deformylase
LLKEITYHRDIIKSDLEVMYLLTMDDIRREGDPVLRKKAGEVQIPLTVEDQKTMLDMLEFLKNSQDPVIGPQHHLRPGVGIAAPQIGVSKRMFAIHCEDDEGKLVSLGLFNPKIVSHSETTIHIPGGEGCLSVDRAVDGIVPRYERLTVKAIDMDGNEVQLKYSGFISIVFQHEIDHLDGIMFFDRIVEETDE